MEDIYNYDLYFEFLQQRILLQNMSDDMLENSIYILKKERKRRRFENFKFAICYLLFGKTQ